MLLVALFFASIFFLAGTFFLTSVSSAFRRIHKRDSKKQLKALGKIFFYRYIHLFFFPVQEYEGIFFAAICAQNITRFFYAIFAYLFLFNTPLFITDQAPVQGLQIFWIVLSFLGFILAGFVFGDFFPRIFGTRMPETALRFSAPVSSLFMLLVFPMTYVFLHLTQKMSRTVYFDHLQEPEAQAKQEIIEIIQKAKMSPDVSRHDKQLIESVLNFRDRIAREVMVPRVDMFSLPANISIKEAAKLLEREGYSRTPVYRDTIDNIVGVLMYKDILKKYMEYEENANDPKILENPVESIQKGVLYTPETKKISNLLQEFRKKQVHLAIVVDEYGGTEGVVTIEDILEEIVGNIEDEYDQEEALYFRQPDNSWLVDARLNILDAEEQLGIKIPQDGDYDTIGGYIYHRAGAIPSKGFVIHHDEFEMEILSSNDRAVEKVRIKPIEKEEEKEWTEQESGKE